MTGLTFDEASHTYHFDGQLVPGVTSILAPLTDFGFVAPEILQAAQAFGKAVHKACELDDLGTLDGSSLDPALEPYLCGWQKFSEENEVDWAMIEAPVFHPKMRYAGTLDRFGKVKGDPAVVDIKSSAVLYPAVGPQLAAYKNAITGVPPLTKRIAVQLKADGTYTAKTYTEPTDWPLFCSLLTVRQWCAQHNITPKF
jgi:hypothetical protein